ncbi:MAG: hypothetical protein GY930_15480 [bacterium]|nr:hypothetical protein [bacterium]
MVTVATNTRRSGFTLVEVTIAATLCCVVLLGVLGVVHKEAKSFADQATIVNHEADAIQALRRIEGELTYAKGVVPSAWSINSLGVNANGGLEVDNLLGFPSRGDLLLGRGTAVEERLTYATYDVAASTFETLTRDNECTNPSNHPANETVLWAPMAIPSGNQVAPAANQFDGRSNELMGPLFFQGDGTGFTFQVPTDPAGGTNFLDGETVRWGSDVAGQPLASGYSALFYDPLTSVTEVDARHDLNNDGDMDDTFDLGYIKLLRWDSAAPDAATTNVNLTGPYILQERCNRGSDLDGDGFEDPLFLWMPDSNTLHVRIFVFAGQINGHVVTRMIDTAVFLQNGVS